MQHIYDYRSFPTPPTITANGIPNIPMGYDNRRSLGVGFPFSADHLRF